MKIIVAAALSAGVALMAVSPANAAQGCGPGNHRGPHGHCHPDRGMMVAPGGLVVGNYYHGRGYWDGHRYWHHRMRDRDHHWQYR